MARAHIIQIACCSCALLLTSAIPVHAGEPQKGTPMMTVSSGKQVTLEYTLKLDDNSVVDSNVGGEPLTLTQGHHHVISGLEQALEGMSPGEKKQVTVAPADGYGLVDPNAFQEVDMNLVPADSRTVGTQLQAKTADGRQVYPRISEVKPQTVVLDFNHPLAGKTLHFDVKVIEVAQGPAK